MPDHSPIRNVRSLVLRTFASPVEIRTQRVLLRQWKDSDLDAWAEMNADPEVRKYFPKVLDRAEADGEASRIRGGIAQRGWGMWAIEIPGILPFAGLVGLNLPAFQAPWMPAVEIGWRLSRDAWHKGYATEGAVAAMNFAFDELHLPEVVAMSVKTNTPSHQVMQRLGMTHDPSADFDHPRVPADWPLKTHILHRISPATWKARRST
ncbi:MAG: GNAT family N-acetyltransferase [Rhodocyclaceae bacterium]|nr:GNAT family N-acetyltransferase [Rhodocyclaceae bacterium]MCA3026833.1 GNAT family N-acetyltransferase [Rhodocyclaceae bacterium]MCA3033120.1 GNAT family N-acetyltransferase [Rhodocyclaceae bacterium]MCA3038486.1 GNAT family N-acetyltransferase [Rhodocyclaceae bacterium]MCA3047936.1 GNAT family N-acetyltransferase [Rhodocyclaceae bacterium]